jgi:hypothetical protein
MIISISSPNFSHETCTRRFKRKSNIQGSTEQYNK